MKPSRGSEYTSGDGIMAIEIVSRGAPITEEARERARNRARQTRNEPGNPSTDFNHPSSDQNKPTDLLE